MNDFSVFIGGKAGDGIDTSSLILARILNRFRYYIYVYRDYPSLIRGGHTFSIIRASLNKISSHNNKIDFLLALNQDCISLHKDRLKENSVIIFNSDLVKPDSIPGQVKSVGLPLEKIVKEENAPAIMRNSACIGGFCKAVGMEWDVLERVFKKNMSKELDINLKVARKGYDALSEFTHIQQADKEPLPLLTGNDAIALGLVKAGLKAYVAYPMTPASGILHTLARIADDFSLKVLHPENEIAVMLMALGLAYSGDKVAVGTSGGGFCLMTEGVSFSGMGELPVAIIVGQRTGPSTGLPTYTGQTELQFVLNAGQGEFSRFVVAPGDADEAYLWSGRALNIAWKYQVPAFILSDKTLSEGTFSFKQKELREENPVLWDRKQPYKRYAFSEDGVSPLTFVSDKDAIIKVNSYEHDELGITTEDAHITQAMQEKRLKKEKYILQEMQAYDVIKVYGKDDAKTTLLCWGSNKGVCIEVAQKLNLKVIQVIMLWPFPIEKFKQSLQGINNIIDIENNATAQLAVLLSRYGIDVNKKILKYNGRPFTVDELEEKVKAVL